MNLTGQFLDFRWFAERFFCIRDRKARIIPFKFNALQEKLHAELTGNDDVLKARKGGVSTYKILNAFHMILTRPNSRALILAHEHKSAIDLFEIVKVAYDHLPDQLRPALAIDSRQEMMLRSTRSRIQAHTAKNPELGRGGTIDTLHCSEIAFWATPQQTLTAVGASLGDDADVLRESTANGAGNYWHQEWTLGKGGLSTYKTHFFPWWIEPSYAVEEPDPVRDSDEFEDDRPLWKTDPNAEFRFTEQEQNLNLTPQQIRWRRRMVRKFKNRFLQEYAEDDVTCFLISGNSVFDNVALMRLYNALTARPWVLKRIDRLGLKVFQTFDPIKVLPWCEFVIGADTSEGIADPEDPSSRGDFSAAYITERRTGIQVASVHGSWEPDEFAHVLAEVGSLFQTPHGGLPLLGVERNEYGHATLNELRNHIRYQNLYHTMDWDVAKAKKIRKTGWRTTGETRPIMVTDLVKAVNRGYLKVRDPMFLAECMTFVKNRKGRPEAQYGCHDDRVMAQAISWQMRAAIAQNLPVMGVNFD
jgi:hypothetical protein